MPTVKVYHKLPSCVVVFPGALKNYDKAGISAVDLANATYIPNFAIDDLIKDPVETGWNFFGQERPPDDLPDLGDLRNKDRTVRLRKESEKSLPLATESFIPLETMLEIENAQDPLSKLSTYIKDHLWERPMLVDHGNPSDRDKSPEVICNSIIQPLMKKLEKAGLSDFTNSKCIHLGRCVSKKVAQVLSKQSALRTKYVVGSAAAIQMSNPAQKFLSVSHSWVESGKVYGFFAYLDGSVQHIAPFQALAGR